MWQTRQALKEKGLTYKSAEDISLGIHFLEKMSQLQERANELGVDLTTFRAKDINQSKGDYSVFIDGSTLMALKRRGFISRTSQETETIKVPSGILSFQHKETGVIVEHWYRRYGFDYTNYNDVSELMEIKSKYNVYALNQDQIDLTKKLLVEAIKAL